MGKTKFRNVMTSAAAMVLAGTLSACGGDGLSGEYGQSEAGQWFTILTFTGDAVKLTMIGSEDAFDGTWTREGDKVMVTAVGETRTLTLDGNGCLDGGPGNSFFSGTICKKP